MQGAVSFRRRMPAATLLTLAVLLCSCGQGAAVTPETARVASVPSTVTSGREPGQAPEQEGDDRAGGSVTVTSADPLAGDGLVQITSRQRLQLPHGASGYAIDGSAGTMSHAFLVVFDSTGTLTLVTHRWNAPDNSVVAQTSCGASAPCSPARIIADRTTGAVTFRGLELTGLNGNTGASALSTLTGTVR